MAGDINSIGIHPDGLDEGALAVMSGEATSPMFETIRFADFNMLKYGILEDGAPDFLNDRVQDNIEGDWSAPVALGNTWGQEINGMEWMVCNYNNQMRTDQHWDMGLWHVHYWQYTASLDQWQTFHDDVMLGASKLAVTGLAALLLTFI